MLIIFSWALSCGQNHHITESSSLVEPAISISSELLNLGNNTITGSCAGSGNINLTIQDTTFSPIGPCICSGTSFSCTINITKIPCSDDPLQVSGTLSTASDITSLDIDFDGDGVKNSSDLDDDNDGILDSSYNLGDMESYTEALTAPASNFASNAAYTKITGSPDLHTGNPTPLFGVNIPPNTGNNYLAFHSTVAVGTRFETWSLELAEPFAIGEEIQVSFDVLVLDPGSRAWNNPSDIFIYGGSFAGDENILLSSVSTGASHLDGWLPRAFSTILTTAISHITVYNVSHATNESYVGMDNIQIKKLFDTSSHKCDADTDDDGLTDLAESGDAAGIAADINGDGMIDLSEGVDSDNDGIMDVFEDGNLLNNTGTVAIDTDNDIRTNLFDLDSDADAATDLFESGHVAGNAADLNTNGSIDDTESSDSDGDGLMDVFE